MHNPGNRSEHCTGSRYPEPLQLTEYACQLSMLAPEWMVNKKNPNLVGKTSRREPCR